MKRTHPGVFLKKVIMKDQCISNQYMYKNSDISKDDWLRFFKGQIPVSNDIAFELGDKLNISIEFWVSMQSDYSKSLK